MSDQEVTILFRILFAVVLLSAAYVFFVRTRLTAREVNRKKFAITTTYQEKLSMIFLVVGTLVLVGMLAITESAFVFGEDLPFLVAVSVPLYFLIRAMRDAYFYVISYDTENVTVQTMMLSRREIPMVEISADTTNFQKFEGRDAKSKVFSFYTKMNNATDLRMRISEKRHAVESWGTDRV